MNTETFAGSAFGKTFVKVLAAGMESRFRYRFFPPVRILEGAALQGGQTVLEIGCGTGYFTVPAAKIIGESGSLVAMDILQESVDLVAQKVKSAGLTNVRVMKGDAVSTGLKAKGFDKVLLFGVIPAPMLPLGALLREVHRVLMEGGTLAVWPPVPGWLPQSVLKSGLFGYGGKRNGVHNFTVQEERTARATEARSEHL
jgi:ubiquinone/menaquinone biosynthesis C-methylase UbiE